MKSAFTVLLALVAASARGTPAPHANDCNKNGVHTYGKPYVHEYQGVHAPRSRDNNYPKHGHYEVGTGKYNLDFGQYKPFVTYMNAQCQGYSRTRQQPHGHSSTTAVYCQAYFKWYNHCIRHKRVVSYPCRDYSHKHGKYHHGNVKYQFCKSYQWYQKYRKQGHYEVGTGKYGLDFGQYKPFVTYMNAQCQGYSRTRQHPYGHTSTTAVYCQAYFKWYNHCIRHKKVISYPCRDYSHKHGQYHHGNVKYQFCKSYQWYQKSHKNLTYQPTNKHIKVNKGVPYARRDDDDDDDRYDD